MMFISKTIALIFVAASANLMVMSVMSTGIDRSLLINQAIQEVNDMYTLDASKKISNAYKRTSLEATMQGNARLKFERAIKQAEKKILEADQKLHREKEGVQAKVEELAKEVLHTPGTILNADEINAIYQQTGCADILESNVPDCSGADVKMYRSTTGVCNNMENPLFGSSGTPFRRLIPSQYEDGVSQLRGTFQAMGNSLVSGGAFSPPNPSPRLVSASVVQDRNISDDQFTHFLMQWGQFLDHDLDLAPIIHQECSECAYTNECAPIRIPDGDSLLDGTTTVSDSEVCLSFVRSIPACDSKMQKINPREQINGLNSFIDGSQVYGSSKELFSAVREANSWRLLTGPNIPENGGESLPPDRGNLVECMGNQTCFLAGDVRVNEHIGLIVMHTIWLREHNRIADRLAAINPTWDNDTIFQVSRQIVGAELQKITYKDYLPLIMGEGYSLISNYTGYRTNTNPSIPNAFATAAFRFGHSQVQPFFNRLNQDFQPIGIGPLNLMDSFFNPGEYNNSNGTDPILRGLLTSQALKVDEFVNDVLTNHLFQTNTSIPGMDLASLNIQRGRDHGLPPYLTWMRWAQKECGLSSELENELTMIRFLQTYGSLETVDLWVGGLGETRLQGGIIGATFACIFARTFEAIRNGDRFYYENNDTATATFTLEQRQAIENASLSRVICNNGDNINSIQPNAFRSDQARVPCSSLPDVDLTQWITPCYLRLRVNRQMADLTFTSLNTVTGTSNMATIPQGQKRTCLAFQCPTSTQTSTVAVFPNTQVMCRVRPNRRLPPNQAFSTSPELYIGTISSGDINPRSGLYSDLNSCMAGRRIALRYWCGRDEITSSQEDAINELESEIEMVEDTELTDQEWVTIKSNRQASGKLVSLQSSNIPEDVRQNLLRIQAQSSDVNHDESHDEKLIALLENVLKKLKETKANEEEAKKTQYTKTHAEEKADEEFQILYKQLSKAFNQEIGKK